MKYFTKDKSIGNLNFEISCSGDWAELGFGVYSSFQLRRSTVTEDRLYKGMFALIGINILWYRFSISYLFLIKPLIILNP